MSMPVCKQFHGARATVRRVFRLRRATAWLRTVGIMVRRWCDADEVRGCDPLLCSSQLVASFAAGLGTVAGQNGRQGSRALKR
jgi:hypothetical protein